MRRSGEKVTQPELAEVRSPITYLDRGRATSRYRIADHLTVAARSPWRYVGAARFVRRNPDLSTGYAFITTRESFGYAVRIGARLMRQGRRGHTAEHLHAHFAHDPALVALLVARLTGMTFSLTAHARDLYQIPQRSLRVRVASASHAITCCANNFDHMRANLEPAQFAKVQAIHHGIDLTQFTPPENRPDTRAPSLITVARLVEKKGIEDLLAACAKVVGEGVEFSLTIYGDGPLRAKLEARCDELGLQDVIRFAGQCTSSTVVEAMRAADLFVLTPFVTDDGDRDGVPNVIVEAMACGLPVVALSTSTSRRASWPRSSVSVRPPRATGVARCGQRTGVDQTCTPGKCPDVGGRRRD